MFPLIIRIGAQQIFRYLRPPATARPPVAATIYAIVFCLGRLIVRAAAVGRTLRYSLAFVSIGITDFARRFRLRRGYLRCIWNSTGKISAVPLALVCPPVIHEEQRFLREAPRMSHQVDAELLPCLDIAI